MSERLARFAGFSTGSDDGAAIRGEGESDPSGSAGAGMLTSRTGSALTAGEEGAGGEVVEVAGAVAGVGVGVGTAVA